MSELRESSRIDAQHFISFDIIDESGEKIANGMGVSSDLSSKGVRLECREAIEPETHLLLHIAVGDEVLPVRGVVRHMEKLAEGKYNVGVLFEELPEVSIRKLATNYPELFKSKH